MKKPLVDSIQQRKPHVRLHRSHKSTYPETGGFQCIRSTLSMEVVCFVFFNKVKECDKSLSSLTIIRIYNTKTPM